ncbi:MAG: bifunctional riboflavin kinase/FAD synthetase [Salinivirgaceae bacterium]|nr:bifunctional riboflavin kinase/FAD synthetase [Salinivirgaceae bacterium]
MEIFNSLENITIDRPVVTIGSFDGVHIGHRQVVENLKAEARLRGGKSVVFTFWPHPAVVLGTDHFHLLSTLDEKIELFKQTGIDYLIVAPFSKAFSQIEYCDFVRDILVGKLHIDTLLLGYDNKIGHNGRGRFDEVGKLAADYGFNIKRMSVIAENDAPVSSTKIRELLSQGEVSRAAGLLGRQYSLAGKVVNGNHIGSTIGFPTANIKPDECKFVPGNGVYAASVQITDKQYFGMLNIGSRPTIDAANKERSIEVHLFNFARNLYGQNLTVNFIEKIRNEQKFNSIEELKNQLQADSRLIMEKVGMKA